MTEETASKLFVFTPADREAALELLEQHGDTPAPQWEQVERTRLRRELEYRRIAKVGRIAMRRAKGLENDREWKEAVRV